VVLETTAEASTNLPTSCLVQGPLECLFNDGSTEYLNWVSFGKPDCWCYRRQCRGDGDGLMAGPFPVGIPDLNLLRAWINKAGVNSTPGICADFDHAAAGPFRVGIPDLNILRAYINKPTASVPQCDAAPIITGPYNFWTN
jgi:hypothetical protein